MGVTATNSTQVANAANVPVITNTVTDHGSRIRVALGNCIQGSAAGDAGSSFNVLYLPYNATVLPQLSFVYCSAYGASRVLAMGFAAYTEYDGTVVSAVTNQFVSAASITNAGYVVFGTTGLSTTPYKFVSGTAGVRDTAGGILITATVTGGTIPALATLDAVICYVID